MNSMKRQKDRTLKDELPRSVGAQYATAVQNLLLTMMATPFLLKGFLPAVVDIMVI